MVLLLGALAVAQAAWAGLMVPMSIEQMAERAQLIVRGTVRSKSCQRDPAGRIYTKVVLDVREIWKGTHAKGELTIVHGGGILGEERVAVSNQVQYDIGEEVVAFLVLNHRGEAVTLGLCQGKFHVWKDEAGQRRARNPFHGHGPHPEKPRSLSSDAANTSETALTLSELKRRVEARGQLQ